jgi:hypothetical protein
MITKIEQLLNQLDSLPPETAFDLAALLQEWQKEFPQMDREEAFIRLLFELGKE